jgi:peptidyl-prolyl cis-trans isomerase C
MGHTKRFWRPLAMVGVVSALLAHGVSGCSGPDRNQPNQSSSIADPVVAATVNSRPIYVSDVEAEAVARNMVRPGEDLDTASDTFYQVLESLIERRLLSMEAEARQLDRSTEVKRRIESARELVLQGALDEQLRATASDSAAVERMYKETLRKSTSELSFRVRHIQFSSKEAAVAAKRRLTLGEEFEVLAMQLSSDRQSGPEGGDLSYVLPEDMPDPIREMLPAATIGQVSEPIQTSLGWHLIRVDDHRPVETPSMDRMRPNIERFLMWQQRQQLLEKLKGEARIERLIDAAPNSGVAAPDLGPDAPGVEPPPPVPMGPGAVIGAAQEPPPAPAGEPEPAPTKAASPPRKRPSSQPAQTPEATPPAPVAPVGPPPADISDRGP